MSRSNRLSMLMRRGHLIHLPTNAGWQTTIVNSGSVSQHPDHIFAQTGAVAGSTGLGYTYVAGLGVGMTDEFRLDWDKALLLRLWIAARDVGGDHTNSVYRMQLKEAVAEGALAAKGVGLRIDGIAAAPQDLFFESYNTGLQATDSGLNLVSDKTYWVDIYHKPGVAVYFSVNGTLEVTHSAVANVPAGESGASIAIVESTINGVSAGDGRLYAGGIAIFQEI